MFLLFLTLAVLCTSSAVDLRREGRHQGQHVFDHLLLVGLAEHVVYPFDLDIMAAEVFNQEVDIEACQAVLVFDHHLVNRLLFHQPKQLLELGTGVAHPGANLVIRLDHLVLLLAGVGDESSHLSIKVAFLFLFVR